MIVNRMTFFVKRGCMEEAVAFVKAEWERASPPHAHRLAIPNIGCPSRTIVIDLEFENLAEHEKAWNEWGTSPEGVAFMEKWDTLIETYVSNEIWTLVD